MANVPLTFPQWSEKLFKPKRYKIAYGGRGSGKSWTFTDALILKAYNERLGILCAREYQSSIAQSVHKLIEQRIGELGLKPYFTIQQDTIKCNVTGAYFVFEGLQKPDSLNSIADIDICWIEEGQTLKKRTWEKLAPSIRKPDSEIWITMNPYLESDVIYNELIQSKDPKTNSVTALMKVNYTENPYFPEVLELERRLMLERDPALYNHIWLGECLTHTDAQVFKDKWEVKEFTPENWDLPFYGMDFGFSQDPTACVKVWVHDETLYVEKEAVKVGLELDDTADYIKQFMPEIETAIIRADCARPESISYLKRHGLPRIQAVKKWGGSVEDGITHIRSYKSIVVHPRCTHTINEMMLYSYKVDQRSGDITTDVLDKHNHVIDSLRYSLTPLMKRKYTFVDAF
jgi:phage terminase large subunit